MISNIRKASGASIPRTNSNNNVPSMPHYQAPIENIVDETGNQESNAEAIIMNAATNTSFLLFDEGEEEGELLPANPPVRKYVKDECIVLFIRPTEEKKIGITNPPSSTVSPSPISASPVLPSPISSSPKTSVTLPSPTKYSSASSSPASSFSGTLRDSDEKQWGENLHVC